MKVTDLINLGRKSLDMFDSYINEEKIEPSIRVYVREFITELEISEAGCRTQGGSKIVKKPDWTKTIVDFMEDKIKSMPEFEQLNQSIAKTYKNNISKIAASSNDVAQSAFWLENFTRRLIYEKLEGTLSDDSLIEYASLFKSELELSPLEYRYVHYIAGIFLEKDLIRISDNALIRKTQKEDLEYIRDIYIDIPRPQVYIPSSILEINMTTKDVMDCFNYSNRIFNSLRLYKLGSIYSKKSNLIKRTAIWPMGSESSSSDADCYVFRQYTVKEVEADNFVKSINTIEQKLNLNIEEKDYRPLCLSIERYNSALLKSSGFGINLMTAVMGLESLFTLEKERGENVFKLGIRVAKLLGNLNFDAVEVRALTEEAYNFRNKVVHGSYISQQNSKRMNEIFPHILNYLRVSLIIFLLNQEIRKDKMIEMIDQATISDTNNEKLKKVLEKNTKEFGEILT